MRVRDLPTLNSTRPAWQKGAVALLFVILTFGLGYLAKQPLFERILAFHLPFFALCVLTFWRAKDRDVWFWVKAGIGLRALLLFSFPNLSDDIYRFIWDGRLMLNGINPFDHLPQYYIQNGLNLKGITPDLFNRLNSPEYFTIYPPVAQYTFLLACWLFPADIAAAATIIKLILFSFEAGSLFLIVRILEKLNLPRKNALLYALNPLIIVEITGNLHFEGGMIFFFLLSVWLLLRSNIPAGRNFWLSAVAMSLAIASKLLPLLFLPFFIKRLGWRKSIGWFSAIALCLLLLFLPLLNDAFFQNFGQSLNLYFRKFEFNASLYYVARWVGYQVKGYNLIHVLGPTLAAVTFLSVLLLSFTERDISWPGFFRRCLFAICIYLTCTTTVHPWYVSLPLVLCLFTPYRFPVLWSGLVMFTYINYSYEPYFENLGVVALEYSLVWAFFGFEIIKMRTPKSDISAPAPPF